MKKITPYSRKVFYYETDKMSIMHHSNYIRLLEESRVWFMEQAGMPFEEIESKGVLMPVLTAGCKYISPLVFDEPFEVYPKIVKFTGVRLELEYRIVSLKSGKLCAEGYSSHCFTDEQLKPVRVKNSHPEIYQLFKEYVDYDITSFSND